MKRIRYWVKAQSKMKRRWRDEVYISGREMSWMLERWKEESRWSQHGFKLRLRDYALSDGVNSMVRAGLFCTLSASANPVFFLPPTLSSMSGWALAGLSAERDMAWQLRYAPKVCGSKWGPDNVMENILTPGPAWTAEGLSGSTQSGSKVQVILPWFGGIHCCQHSTLRHFMKF